MKRKETESWPKPTLTLVGGGKKQSGYVLTPYGPVRAGLTTSPRTNTDQVLTELLNDLEKQATILQYKSSKVLDILLSDTTHLVTPTDFGLDQAHTTTDEC
jgi:hypothetical protein